MSQLMNRDLFVAELIAGYNYFQSSNELAYKKSKASTNLNYYESQYSAKMYKYWQSIDATKVDIEALDVDEDVKKDLQKMAKDNYERYTKAFKKDIAKNDLRSNLIFWIVFAFLAIFNVFVLGFSFSIASLVINSVIGAICWFIISFAIAQIFEVDVSRAPFAWLFPLPKSKIQDDVTKKLSKDYTYYFSHMPPFKRYDLLKGISEQFAQVNLQGLMEELADLQKNILQCVETKDHIDLSKTHLNEQKEVLLDNRKFVSLKGFKYKDIVAMYFDLITTQRNAEQISSSYSAKLDKKRLKLANEVIRGQLDSHTQRIKTVFSEICAQLGLTVEGNKIVDCEKLNKLPKNNELKFVKLVIATLDIKDIMEEERAYVVQDLDIEYNFEEENRKIK